MGDMCPFSEDFEKIKAKSGVFAPLLTSVIRARLRHTRNRKLPCDRPSAHLSIVTVIEKCSQGLSA